MPERAPRPRLAQKKPPFFDRMFFWVFAALFALGVLKLERDLEE